MPYRDSVANAQTKVFSDMHQTPVLDIGGGADDDLVDICSQDTVKPDRTVSPQGHLADDTSRRGNPCGWIDLGRLVR